MALYEVAQQTRQTLKVGIFLLILVLILKISWNLAIYLYNCCINPPKIPAPEVCYGKIYETKLKSLPLKEGANPTYRLDTVTGKFPILPDRAPVYKLGEPAATISVERNAELFATDLGFITPKKEESAVVWLWEDKVHGRKLKMNIISGDFELETDLLSVAPTTPRGSAPKEKYALDSARNFLSKHGLLTEALLSGTQKVSYLAIQGNSLRLAKDLANAQVVEIIFFASLPVFPEDYPGFGPNELPNSFSLIGETSETGSIKIYVTGSSTEAYKFPIIHYRAQLIDETDRCTYPLKSISTVWGEITSGQSTITHLRLLDEDPYTNYTPLGVAEIKVSEIKILYLESGKTSKRYLQPIFVFEGEGKTTENKRARYVSVLPAVDSRCLGNENDIGTPCPQ